MTKPRSIPQLEQLIADLEEDIARPWPSKKRAGDYAARSIVDQRDRRLLGMAQELLELRKALTRNGVAWEDSELEDA